MTAGGDVVAGADWFPGATSVSRVRVYDWPTVDGCHGGSPHLHTISSEGYVVLAGGGWLQTISGDGYAEHVLGRGTVLWFSPGTVHRLINGDGDLEILVVMQNAGLPEAGDAVLTFPEPVLADPEAYARAAAMDPKDRRDLAVEGYLRLRDRVEVEGPSALAELYRAAARLVEPKLEHWTALWRDRALAQAERAGDRLRALAAGDATHLAASGVFEAEPVPPPRRYGMCGRLRGWNFEEARRGQPRAG